VGMILESYISYDKNWLLKVSWNQNNHQGYIWWYSVLKMIDPILNYWFMTKKWIRYCSICLNRGIGKIKINQSKMN
jgi:hypothetical protein